jgi:serine phosphatase RsbU (regulator of sigma subunit)
VIPTDGGVLIVVGDVAGKGLEAGMLVAHLVGVVRNQAAHSSDPLAILGALNACLCERNHALATCLALLVRPRTGTATLANAGHLPPYLNGHELPMEGALPLGAMAGAEFSVKEFEFDDGATLTLMTDGVAEAQDAEGRLFGFERIAEMLRGNTTAADLADAAQRFGQEDDITVLTVARTG